jgi:hypothetical protein
VPGTAPIHHAGRPHRTSHEAYEWALTLGDTDAAVDAVIGIAELNGLQIDSVEIQHEIQATLAQIGKD